MSRDLDMSSDRYLKALKRFRALIADGEPLVAWDIDDPGAKETHCSWGLCSRNAKSWPDPEDHLWPDQFEQHGRVAPKYRNAPHKCPFDPRDNVGGMGCFFKCRIFRLGSNPRMDRETALRLYDEQIAKAEGR